MQAGARGVAGRAGRGDPLARRDGVPGRDGELLAVGVEGLEAVPVIEADPVAVRAVPAGFGDVPVRRRKDGLARLRPVVDALVPCLLYTSPPSIVEVVAGWVVRQSQ